MPAEPRCQRCGHGRSIHEITRTPGPKPPTVRCVLAHCDCAYRGQFQVQVEPLILPGPPRAGEG